MAKRFTFADAKKKIADLEAQLKNLDTSDNVYTKEENAAIKLGKEKLKSLKFYKVGFWILLFLHIVPPIILQLFF